MQKYISRYIAATNAEGRSSTVPSVANTLRVLAGNAETDGDGLTNSDELARGLNPLSADTDGDGFSDSEEMEFGSNPLDPGDTPVNVSLQIRVACGPPVSMLHSTDPCATPLQNASSPVVSMLNSRDPSAIPLQDASSPVVPVLNSSESGTEPAREATGVPVSILNSPDPSGPGIEEAMGAIKDLARAAGCVRRVLDNGSAQCCGAGVSARSPPDHTTRRCSR